jgi:hypothetical protein
MWWKNSITIGRHFHLSHQAIPPDVFTNLISNVYFRQKNMIQMTSMTRWTNCPEAIPPCKEN